MTATRSGQGSNGDNDEDPPAILEPQVARPVGQDPDEHDVVRGMVMEALVFSGPLPPPDMLRDYEQILPGFADRMLTMTEKQAELRRSIENRNTEANIAAVRRGQWMAFALALVVFVFGGVAVVEKQTIAGSLIMGIDALGLVSLFIAREVKGRAAQRRLPQFPFPLRPSTDREGRRTEQHSSENADGGHDTHQD